MAIRYNLIGERRRPVFGQGRRDRDRDEKRKKSLPLGRAIQGFFLILAIHVALAVAMLVMDPAYFDVAVHSGKVGTNFCARVSHLIPEAWQTVTICRAANALPFLFLPSLVLLYIVRRLLRGDVGD